MERELAFVPMTGGGTDAAFAARSGKATVLESFGLAGWGYHAKDEYIEADSIVPRLYLVTRLLTELGKQYPPPAQPGVRSTKRTPPTSTASASARQPRAAAVEAIAWASATWTSIAASPSPRSSRGSTKRNTALSSATRH